MSGQAITILKEAYELCQNKKFDEAIQKCQVAMEIYKANNDSVGVSCCLINISNVYRNQAFHEYKKTTDTNNWINFPSDPKKLDEYFTYLGCLGSAMWYSHGGGAIGSLKSFS